MPELLNGYQASAYAAHYAGAKLIIGDNDITKKIKSFTDFTGKVEDSDVEAAIGGSLSSRVFTTRRMSVRKASLARVPVVGVSEEPFLQRDSGAIIFLPQNNQELFDFIVMAYNVAEDKKVMLPAVVGIDFLSARTREVVDVQTQKIIENFLPLPEVEKPEKHVFSAEETIKTKAQLQKAMDNSKKIMLGVFEKYKKKFRRQYGPVEKFMLDDASAVIVTYGSITGNAKLAAQRLREQGEKTGVLCIRVLRPFPEASLEALKGKKVAVLEPTHAPGSGGIMCSEIRSRGIDCSSYICGKSVSVAEFEDVFKRLKASQSSERIWMI
jgi:pyruvate ferredoxin oxidoreductase alpha subunit